MFCLARIAWNKLVFFFSFSFRQKYFARSFDLLFDCSLISIKVYNGRDLTEEMTKIQSVLSDDKNDWEHRVAAVSIGFFLDFSRKLTGTQLLCIKNSAKYFRFGARCIFCIPYASGTTSYDHIGLIITNTCLCSERIESPVISLFYNLVNPTTFSEPVVVLTGFNCISVVLLFFLSSPLCFIVYVGVCFINCWQWYTWRYSSSGIINLLDVMFLFSCSSRKFAA